MHHNKHINIIFMIFCVTIFLSIISQTGTNNIIKLLMYVGWILVFLLTFLKNNLKINSSKFITMYFIIIIFNLIMDIIKSIFFGYQISNLTNIMMIPLFVYLIGNNISNILLENEIYILTRIYIISTLVLSLYIHFTYFPSLGTWFSNWEYVYSSKNSLVQIIMISVIFLLFLKNKRKKIKKSISIIKYIISIYLIFICILLQGRTALIGICVIFLYVLILKKNFSWWIIALCLVLLVVVSPNLSNIIIHSFQLDKYTDITYNQISSGRTLLYIKTFKEISEHILFGIGKYYVDNFYLNIAAETGIFGFFPVVLLLTVRVKNNININSFYKDCDGLQYTWEFIGILCSIFLFVESLMEAFPPFGPGVCSCMFWLVCGYLDDIYRKELA